MTRGSDNCRWATESEPPPPLQRRLFKPKNLSRGLGLQFIFT
jgi:hypothetical protein